MKIGLVGNQNSGKTTLFNALTGSNQTIGNWPGVTIERKEGILKGTSDVRIIDLPGIYSLSPYTPEEEVSRRFIIDEKPDLIINIVDSTSIERSLYLTTQLMELDADVVLALNMTDILKSHGLTIDVEKLSKKLGLTIVQISAMKETGIDTLIDVVTSKKYLKNPHTKIYPDDIEELIKNFSKKILADNKRFSAVKLIEDDRGYHGLLSIEGEKQVRQLEETYDMDGEQLIASKRYEFVENVREKCVTKISKKESITDKLDRVFLNRWAAIPIFVLIMGIVYFISIGIVGGITSPLIDVLFNGASIDEATEFNMIFASFEKEIDFIGIGPWLASLIAKGGGSSWAVSLVKDGIVGGVGAVLGFFPQILVMFIFLTLLETTGYMNRIAFFLDRVFHKFGLSGKSLIPFIVGSGCSVPAIMSSKIVEDDNERKSTMILTPFIPCSAKLPVIALFAGWIPFFGNNGWLVSLSLYFMAFAAILLGGYIFKKFIFKGEHSSFIAELPEYKVPKAKYVFRDVWDKSFAFIKKASSIILVSSILIWFLSNFSWKLNYLDGENIESSILAGIGNGFAWFFYPMLGKWSWEASVTAIQGLVAKEQVVASMSILSGGAKIFSDGTAFAFLTGPTAYAFLVFNLFSAPCFAALGALRKESGNFKTFLFAVIFQIGFAWVLSSLIGIIGRGIML